MSIFSVFQKPPPPPIYKRQPIATIAVVLTMIGMFTLGPIGVIYNGMSEELKGKADYDTVILLMKNQEEKAAKEREIQAQKDAAQKEKDDRQWKAIEQMIQAPKSLSIKTDEPIGKEQKSIGTLNVEKKVALTPSEFEKYMSLAPDVRVKYKKYLESTGKDVSGLPD